jgi:hypothetical protein
MKKNVLVRDYAPNLAEIYYSNVPALPPGHSKGRRDYYPTLFGFKYKLIPEL